MSTSLNLNSNQHHIICPYLDTVQRNVLDFDFERCCSVTLEKGPHIYGCLVCGKYFRGKGRQTPAFTHSVEEGHYVFIHLQRGKFVCLPDDYEIRDASLQDISAALNPRFTKEDVAKLDRNHDLSRDLFGKVYLPGYVGLNNLNKTDYVNACMQALAQVRPLRDFFLKFGTQQQQHLKAEDKYSSLALRFGELMRKMWSNQRFKSSVDPHEMIQAISAASNKRFHVGKQAEASAFMSWFLNSLHIGLGGSSKKRSIISKIFQGEIELTIRQRVNVKKAVNNSSQLDDRLGSDDEANGKTARDEKKEIEEEETIEIEETTRTTKFLQLQLDMPEKALFKDDKGGLVIPQEPLFNILKKFDGETFSDSVQNSVSKKRRYRLKRLPSYLILHLARFKRNPFGNEKNPTIVTFPVKNLDLSNYVRSEENAILTIDEIKKMKTKELKRFLKGHGKSDQAKNIVEKEELVKLCSKVSEDKMKSVLGNKFDLVANICHDSPPEVGREGKRDPLDEGSYRCHIQHKASSQWYEIQDLHVVETMPQLIGLSESYLLIFERKDLSHG